MLNKVLTAQPQYPAQIDDGQPFAQYLAFAATGAFPTFDAALNTQGAPTNVFSVPVAEFAGRPAIGGKVTASASSGVNFGTAPARATRQDWTVLIVAAPLASSSAPNSVLGFYHATNGRLDFTFNGNNSSGTGDAASFCAYEYKAGVTRIGAYANSVCDAKPHVFCATRSGTTYKTYVDGVDRTTGTAAVGSGITKSSLATGFLTIPDGVGTCCRDTPVYLALFFDGVGMPPGVVAEVSKNPWRYFAAPQSVWWSGLPAAGGGTPIYSDLEDSAVILNSVTSDLADSAVIMSAVSSDLEDSAVIRSAVSSDLEESAIILSSVSSDLADSAVILNSITSDLSDSYGIQAATTAVSSDLGDSATIYNSTSSDLTDAALILTSLASDLSDSYDIQAATTVASDLFDSATIYNTVGSDLADSAEIRVSVSSDLADSATVFLSVSSDLDDSAIILNAAYSDLVDSATVFSVVTSDLIDAVFILSAAAALFRNTRYTMPDRARNFTAPDRARNFWTGMT